MSSWTKADSAAGAPLWACSSVGLAPSAANRTNLFEDADADNFITGATVGLFNYAAGEIIAGSHQGWVLKTTGSGGRNGRVTGETLVCLTSNS
jgi:hypothetical protein